MNLTQLNCIREIARAGNITSAARNLFRTQPAVSKQVKLLERELACKLFYRSGRKMLLTHEGELVYRAALEIFERMRILEDALEAAKATISGNIHIGCGPTTARHILPHLIEKYLERYPDVNFSITETDSERIPGLLKQGHVELGMCMKSFSDRALTFENLFTDRLVLTCSQRHPLSKKRRVTRKDLHRFPLIQYLEGFFMQDLIREKLDPERGAHNIFLEMKNTESIVSFVQKNLGIALIPSYLVRLLNPDDIVVKPLEKEINITFGLCYMKDRYLPNALRAFIDFTKEIWRTIHVQS